MDLKTYGTLEAVLGEIEDHEILLLENKATLEHYAQFSNRVRDRMAKGDGVLTRYKVFDHVIKWQGWLAETRNVHQHNLEYFRSVLGELIEKMER